MGHRVRPRINLSVGVLLFVLAACSGAGVNTTDRHRAVASSFDAGIVAWPDLQSEFEDFQSDIEEALVWRAQAIDFYNEVIRTRKTIGHMTADQLERLHVSAVSYLALHERLLEAAKKRAWLVNWDAKVEFRPGAGTTFGKTTAHPWQKGFWPTQVDKIRIDPQDELGRRSMLELKVSLGAALVLFDNYIFGIYPYYDDKKIRYLVDREYPEIKGRLKEATKAFVRNKNRKQISKGIALFERERYWRDSAAQDIVTPEERYLDLLIRQSPSYFYAMQGYKSGPSKGDFVEGTVEESFTLTQRTLTFYLSKFFGNGVGLVEFRQGKMLSLPPAEKAELATRMKPLDILLEKTPFRLTDQFIPGHFGHVAIWAGTEDELKALGIWENQWVAPFHKKIRSGARIIEALRPGVEINTMEHFLDIDDLAVLRYADALPIETQREYLIRAFQQIGKEYDFNFDVETGNKIVCSEIAYVVFHDIEWPTQKSGGRYTISPDHVAIKAYEGGPLEPLLIYHDGLLLPSDRAGGLSQLLRLLLEGKYDELERLLAMQE